MMKRLRMILLALLLVVSTAACGTKEEKVPEKVEEPKQEQSVDLKPEVSETVNEDIQEEQNIVVPLQVFKTEEYVEEWAEAETGAWDEEYKRLLEVSWQELILGKECAEEYPELAKVLNDNNLQNRQFKQESVAELLTLAKESYEYDKEFFSTYSSTSEYFVQRGDNLILSVREDIGEYTGGMHGMYGSFGINYDTAAGKELTLSDVLEKTDVLPEMLAEKIKEQYADEYETFESLQETLEAYALEDYQWTMNYQGITFYFQPYEIASYAMGLITVTIGFDENPELFKEAYMEAPKGGYAMELPLGTAVEVDLETGDGMFDKLIVSGIYKTEEDEEYGTMRIMLGKNDVFYQVEDDYGYVFKPYFVCVGEKGSEKYFVYVEGVAENDYRTLYVFDINGEEIIQQPSVYGIGFGGYWDETVGEYGAYYDEVLLNPTSFELGTRMHILGTWTGIKTYAADAENGLPQTEDEFYDISDEDYDAISTIPLELKMAPDGTVEEIPAGSKYYFLRTDGETYMDFRLEDGREGTIEVEYKEWNYTINGIDEWDCFEMLLYAG